MENFNLQKAKSTSPDLLMSFFQSLPVNVSFEKYFKKIQQTIVHL
jgi:hypothetical protein